MPSITVNIDGKPAFSWEGDELAVCDTLARWREIAAAQQLDPELFAVSGVMHWKTADLATATPQEQEVWMMGVTYWILSRDTGDPKRPGKFGDYVPVWDFDIDLRRRAGKVVINVTFNAGRGLAG